MSLDIKIGDREARVRILSMEGNRAIIDVDGITYDVDIVMVEEGVYSIIHQGKSYNIEMIPGNGPKNYYVNTYSSSHEVEIIDSQSRYQKSRNKNNLDSAEKIITTPMPGKVVRIPVTVGQAVAKGATVIVISAMKMESEYRSPIDGVVKKIYVNEGDTIIGNQPLIEIE
ncbi:MAG: acetyl-CoA carboxylase biotin carboxyl carrier protein subunit [Bacteroidetes bacterium HGW-Bacteroidetes-15]|nr:MAG: acetyl-CoA carboxylase biotin carboxyl carrier protein subunit [Bacteroidetes bacterium HGW-Bacteroidetes-15]